MNSLPSTVILMGMLCLCPFFVFSQPIFINAATLNETHNGASWDNAWPDFQAALNSPEGQLPGAVFWIAEGVYKPDGNNRNATFMLPPGAAIFGGFSGSETNIDQRDIAAHPTVFSGNIGDASQIDDNAYTLLQGAAGNFIFDGLTFQDANGLGELKDGNYTETFNGAAIHIKGNTQNPSPEEETSLTISNCVFKNNQAYSGGAVFFAGKELSIQNCQFQKNKAILKGGAVFCNQADEELLRNNIFYENEAKSGGAYATQALFSTHNHCTFFRNYAATFGAAIEASVFTSGAVTNSILWGGAAGQINASAFQVLHSVLPKHSENYFAEEQDNSYTDPEIYLDVNKLLQLWPCSPAINAAADFGELPELDVYFNNRITDGQADIGAVELNNQNAPVATTDIFVNAHQLTGNQDGSSWQNAFQNLQDAFDHVACNEAVRFWVAEGVYHPGDGTSKNQSFEVPDFCQLYGGFAGDETSLEQRNPALYKTIISGNIGAHESREDNNIHLLNLQNTTGFQCYGIHFTGGNANSTFGNSHGQKGGAIYWAGDPEEEADAVFYNSTFYENNATFKGGAVYTSASGFQFLRCRFYHNFASRGGAFYFDETEDYLVENSIFYGNNSDYDGAAFHGFLAKGEIINCSFYKNIAGISGAVIHEPDELFNSIIWQGTGAMVAKNSEPNFIGKNCLIQGLESDVTGNPMFNDPENGDLGLQACSPAIDAAEEEGDASEDLNGNVRIFGDEIDIGALEWQGTETEYPAGPVVFVDVSNSNTIQNGNSWETAFTDLNEAFAKMGCAAASEIWVAKGVYKTDANGSRNKSFTPLPDIKIYGGFAGNETSLAERNLAENQTILSGELGDENDSKDNAYHIFMALNTGQEMIVDGFVFENAYANGEGLNGTGAGIYNVANAANGSSSIQIRNCIFRNNFARLAAGVYNKSFAADASGGDANVLLENVVFYQNIAMVNAGLRSYTNASGRAMVQADHCTFYQNSAGEGAAIGVSGAGNEVAVSNSILWGGTGSLVKNDNGILTINHCLLQEKFDGTGNIYAHPKLVSSHNGNLRPLQCSPVIDAANGQSVTTTDLDGNDRVIGMTADIGAYEYQGTPFPQASGNVIYVKADATNPNADGSSWAMAYPDIQSAMDKSLCHDDASIWIAAGTYRPSASGNPGAYLEWGSNVNFYGGFAGNETSLDERNFNENSTIISGDLGNGKKSYLLMMALEAGSGKTLSGIHFQDAFADPLYSRGKGAALLVNSLGNEMVTSAFTVENCVFENNVADEGAAICHKAVLHDINLLYENCVFNNNVVANNGGAIVNEVLSGSCNNVYKNCRFNDNVAASIGGVVSNQGNVFNNIITNDFLNCLFYNNDADIGPCIYNIGGEGMVDNCTFYLNRTPAISGFNNAMQVQNSIFWGPADGSPISTTGSVSGSIVKGGMGADNMNEDPLFFDAASENFRLRPCSPAIDAGENLGVSAFDMDQQNRVYNGQVDLGAYEFTASVLGMSLFETSGEVLPATHSYMDTDGWRHFYNCDEEKLLLSMQETSTLQSMDFDVRVGVMPDYGVSGTDLTEADYHESEAKRFSMNRYWEVVDAPIPDAPIFVRFYYTEQDVIDVKNSLINMGSTFSGIEQIMFYKVDQYNEHPLEEIIMGNNGAYQQYNYGQGSGFDSWVSGNFEGYNYAEFKVNSFSGGTGAVLEFESNLPVEMVDFTATLEDDQVVRLDWTTASEYNSDYYIVERSADGRNFETIELVPAQGQSNELHAYRTYDKWPERGVNYYRLKQYDYNGEYYFSRIVSVMLGNVKEQSLLYPNPVQETLYVQLPERLNTKKVQVELIDSNERVLQVNVVESADGELLHFDCWDLPSGTYFLTITAKKYFHTEKIIVENGR